MLDAGVAHVAKLESAPDVAAALAAFLAEAPGAAAPPAVPDRVREMSRASRARALAAVLDDVVAAPVPAR